jgi:phage-related baseplate assembly protein
LANGVLANQAIKDAILAICNDEKVRPQNDLVLIGDPSVVEYAISVELIAFNGAVNADILLTVNESLNTYKTERLNKLGMDIVVSQIIALCMVKDKVYKATVISPVADIISDESTYTKCTGITVTITGNNDG